MRELDLSAPALVLARAAEDFQITRCIEHLGVPGLLEIAWLIGDSAHPSSHELDVRPVMSPEISSTLPLAE